MFKPFRTAAVLGAGVMGSQIAAHLANAGLTVHLLDLAGKGSNKNELVETSFKKALKLSPPIFFTEKTARRVIVGNFDEHFDSVAAVDWVIEAVVENLDIKQKLMERLESVIRSDTIVSTNTSGLPIDAIAQGRSESFRQRFLGTHFFNPPRYLKLLEIIPTADTDPQVLERMKWFGELHLGKGVVVAKDTPNFIANRIGMYVTMLGLQALTQGYTIEEIDTLTGTIAGRPKSATFRTADLVGLDTLMYVASNLYPAIPHDESREVFRVPELLRKLVETGTLGAKTGQGFYKKQDRQILSLNPETLAYEPAKPLNLGDIEAIGKIPDLGDRLRALYRDRSRAGAFFRESILKTLSYAACRIPEIADSPTDIDKAMRWGFGWELGPFEIWDVLGFETVLADMKAAGMTVPEWAEVKSQKSKVKSENLIFDSRLPLIWQNPEAALLDMGDGVVLYEFRSKGNTLSLQVVDGLTEVLDLLENDYRGLVIGNSSAHFSGGANLAEMAMMAQSGLGAIADLIVKFQTLLQRIHYFPKPIVAAIQGRVLGGGCELVMACPQVVAAAETYIGLVELSVGLIPGAGGIMRSVTWAADRAATEAPHHIQPFLRRVFETIGMAKVSNSAAEAQELGFLPPTARILMNGDRRLEVAKEEVLCSDRAGYAPPPERNAIMVLGRPGRAMLDYAADTLYRGGFISEYDRYLANRLAYVMAGGELSAPALVDENYLLQLEREAFLPLLSQPKTQERIAHTLKHKKPLRN
ncbi:3-hydroxyacyl-CoA dehydrogenase/enoyl-CoA hydratase family protein [Chroococcidiopsis sp. CCNUC1]|uniref:3-hydroxyacyl-CoA dehydrogenase/enoyl-CoA hydratase family protein n=1 Tax=Chroococcidiopsis sp. CCNUC1 TaxID=2653189 RepID=UPI000D074E6C|nr:3-hydroxyacyl-CoA dehydrogenase/enoyl-CoA hydratase family protein [Chroococcidiopsis sp. CCNUC1]PSB49001.1 3-hydroxyacyl-CoA dehydrogenase [Cyanosarcina cf. burmensis CCALA 770]URD47684.1 3-hydroxyacyl-CoA dehydrogenase NAD-binding domain-containing protein [Chroococcidiopsis sp. CCNUC1]